MKLKDFKTFELVEELENRMGVETLILDIENRATLNFEGPCILLKIID